MTGVLPNGFGYPSYPKCLMGSHWTANLQWEVGIIALSCVVSRLQINCVVPFPVHTVIVTTRLTTGLVGDSYRKPSIATIAGNGGNPNDKGKGAMVRCHFPFHWYTLQSVTKNTLNISCVSVWNTVPNRSQMKWPPGTKMVSAYLWTKHPRIYTLKFAHGVCSEMKSWDPWLAF